MSKLLKPVLLLYLLVLTHSVTAQYWNQTIMDDWRTRLNRDELAFDPLLANSAAKISLETDAGRIEYLNNSIRPIEVERYSEIFGDPYLNKNFSQAKLMDATGQQLPLAPLNYNAFSGRMEFREENSHFQFLPNYFPKVILTDDNGREETMIYSLIPSLGPYYSVVVFNGEHLKAAVHLTVTKAKNEGFSGGAGTASERFIPVKALYLKVGDRWERAGFKVKQIAAVTGFGKEISAYEREHRTGLKDHADLAELLAHLDGLMGK